MMNRYQRQTMVEQIGSSGQNKLAKARVAIIGAGGLGCPVSTYLTGAGVGDITLIDHDIVSETNLHRQVLFGESDIGTSKVLCAQKRLSGLNSEVSITAVSTRITVGNCDSLLEKSDVIVDACDNFSVSYLLSDYCLRNNKPLISASAMQTQGYVGVYCYRTDKHTSCASMRAVFPDSPPAGQDCNSVGVIGTSVGIIGMIQAQEVLKVILCDSAQLAEKLLYIDLWNYRQSSMSFAGAPEPKVYASIIDYSMTTDNDWIVDVRRLDEVEKNLKKCNQHIPLLEINYSDLPDDKRIVFTCSSGQRALTAADRALQAGMTNISVIL